MGLISLFLRITDKYKAVPKQAGPENLEVQQKQRHNFEAVPENRLPENRVMMINDFDYRIKQITDKIKETILNSDDIDHKCIKNTIFYINKYNNSSDSKEKMKFYKKVKQWSPSLLNKSVKKQGDISGAQIPLETSEQPGDISGQFQIDISGEEGDIVKLSDIIGRAIDYATTNRNHVTDRICDALNDYNDLFGKLVRMTDDIFMDKAEKEAFLELSKKATKLQAYIRLNNVLTPPPKGPRRKFK